MHIVKAKAIINLIYNTEMINLINMFSNFEFVNMKKSSKIYFIWIYGVSWKKERTIWKGIIEKVKNYNPIGAKPEQVDKVFKGNVISEIYKNLWMIKKKNKNQLNILFLC